MQTYDVEGDVNHNQNIGLAIVNMVKHGKLEKIQQLVLKYPNLNLSRFPGAWQVPAAATPLTLSASHGRIDIFMFLLSCKVDLEVFFSFDVMITQPGEGEPAHPQRRNGNILSFCLMKQRNPNTDYFEYAQLLIRERVSICNPNIELDVQPLFLLCLHMHYILEQRQLYRHDPVQLAPWDIKRLTAYALVRDLIREEVMRGTQSGADILMDIFCGNLLPDSIKTLNILGLVLLSFLLANRWFNIDLYDLDRLYYDRTTQRVFELVQAQQGEKNLAVAMALGNRQSRFGQLGVGLVRNILEKTEQPNLAVMRADECCVCYDTKNLHQVCENKHKLCPECRLDLTRRGDERCPTCRAPRFGV